MPWASCCFQEYKLSIYLISTIVFLAILLTLAVIILALESTIAPQGRRKINLNGDGNQPLEVMAGATLLQALALNNIYLPSGCGGGGTCGLCKCRVTAGGDGLLPTEQPHLSRAERLDKIRLACQLKVKQDLKVEIPAHIFDIKKYAATVVTNRSVAAFIKELTVKLDTDKLPDFKSGEYMQIDIPPYTLKYADFDIPEPYRGLWARAGLFNLTATLKEPTFRAYSMANYPLEAYLMFTIRIEPPPGNTNLPPGMGSSYLFGLKPGAKLTLSGPFGEFQLKDSPREMCFIGGGVGMAPLRSQIFDLLKNKRAIRKITFWYGARSRLEMFYDSEFKALAREHPNFSYQAALSDPAPGDGWEGAVGPIHEVCHDRYLREHADPQEIDYYLCGPPLMLGATLQMLDGLGVEPEMIAYDDFGQGPQPPEP